jgi:hypothetical protein
MPANTANATCNKGQSPILSTEEDLIKIRSRYEEYGSPALIDHIYEGKSPETFDINALPSHIYNHGVGKPESITAGIPGIHVYIMPGHTPCILAIFWRQKNRAAYSIDDVETS